MHGREGSDVGGLADSSFLDCCASLMLCVLELQYSLLLMPLIFFQHHDLDGLSYLVH